MANKKKHLSEKERFCVEKMLGASDSLSEIARTLGRGLSTLSEEINKNGGRDNYSAERAERRAYWRQYRKKRECNKVAMDGNLTRFVERHLSKRWSPEIIASRLKIQPGLDYASGKSIRKFIGKRFGLERFLFWNRNNHKSGRKNNKWFFDDPLRKFIDERPIPALFEYGHWEADFIVSKHNSFVLLVLVEKHSKLKKLAILPNRANDLVNMTIARLLAGRLVLSLTIDNDIAFTKWRDLERMLGASVYFCHPYHSWEKGLVENTNRWIREFVPKRSDLSKYSKDFIQAIEDWFNRKPSERLNGLTPYEKMMEKEGRRFVSSLAINFPIVRIWG